MDTYLIGLDCAAQHSKFGVALGSLGPSGMQIHKVETNNKNVVPVIVQWIKTYQPRILAFDAPMGWPATLGEALGDHCAGIMLPFESDDLFHRETDKFVRKKLNKRPLEVGADKIARAAATALRVASTIRKNTGIKLRLLWEPGIPNETGMIEVYPAATLLAHSFSEKGYKGNKAEHREARSVLLKDLSEFMKFNISTDLLVSSDDALDAVICIMAAVDFAKGTAYMPENIVVARKEGWIWFNKTKHKTTVA